MLDGDFHVGGIQFHEEFVALDFGLDWQSSCSLRQTTHGLARQNLRPDSDLSIHDGVAIANGPFPSAAVRMRDSNSSETFMKLHKSYKPLMQIRLA